MRELDNGIRHPCTQIFLSSVLSSYVHHELMIPLFSKRLVTKEWEPTMNIWWEYDSFVQFSYDMFIMNIWRWVVYVRRPWERAASAIVSLFGPPGGVTFSYLVIIKSMTHTYDSFLRKGNTWNRESPLYDRTSYRYTWFIFPKKNVFVYQGSTTFLKKTKTRFNKGYSIKNLLLLFLLPFLFQVPVHQLRGKRTRIHHPLMSVTTPGERSFWGFSVL